MIIDANMYYVPEQLFEDEALLQRFIDEVPSRYGWYGKVSVIPGREGKKQIVLEKPEGFANLNYAQGDYVLETMLADLDRAGADKAILKIPGCHEWMSLSMCSLFNNGMADYAWKSSGRLIPMAAVPPYGSMESLLELERCRKELGMTAVQVSAHYGNKYLDEDIFAAFFEKVNELQMTVYVHHTPIPTEYQAFCTYNNVRRSYGRCVDQGLAVGREMFSNFFVKYPNIKMVHSMLGGGFFAIADMMFPAMPKNTDAVNRFQSDGTDMKQRFRDHIYFEMSHAQPWGSKQLECAVAVLGADHIIWGTSYPVRREWLLGGVEFVKSLDISDEDKDKILGLNAKKIYHLESKDF